MRGFYVIDALGNTKMSQFGSSSAISDPVTPAHGGTGLVVVTQGDLIYASADGIIASLPKDISGTRILTNLGVNNNPVWSDPASNLGGVPNPTTRKFALLEWATNVSPTGFVWGAAVTASSVVADTVSQWGRFSTGISSGTAIGMRISNDWAWIDHLPKLNVHFRTGANLAACRIWFTLSNVGAALIGNSDDQHLLKGVGVRYSTSAPDAGFVPWTSDGTTQAIGSVVTPIAASTSYSLSIEVTSSISMTVTINGVSQTVAVPAGALGTLMRPNVQITTLAAVNKDLDVDAMYGEWN